jgi:circadian clock protein KaiB
MKKNSLDRSENTIEIFEKAIKGSEKQKYLLRLYVAGTSAKSTRAINNIKNICEEHLKGRFELEVIDIYQQPALAEGEQIIAAPTLVKKLPPPLRKFIGDLADTEKILVGLDIKGKTDK